MNNIPYWRLSNFYLFYFAALGVFIPFWGLYLQQKGFSPQAIGELVAILMLTKIIAPNVWGWLADYTGKTIIWVRIGSILACISFAGILLNDSYWWYVLIMIAFSFFWNATLPLVEATTFSYLGEQARRYSYIRLWGSVGFIVSVGVFGIFFEYMDILWLPYLFLGLLTGLWLVSGMIPEKPVLNQLKNEVCLTKLLLKPEILALFLVCLLLQMSHAPYYTFYSIYLEQHEYSRKLIGWMWALAVLAEVGLFLLSYRLLRQFSLSTLLTITCFLTAFRWWLIANFIDILTILLLAQLFHAISFGLYHAVAILLIHQYFSGSLRSRGQALYSSISFGVGGSLGSYMSGYFWDYLGGYWTYQLAMLICLCAGLISFLWVKDGNMHLNQDF